MAKYKVPNLENATVPGLLDLISSERETQKAAKFYEGVYRSALYARLDPPIVDSDPSTMAYWGGRTLDSDTRQGKINHVVTQRFNLDKFRLDHPTLYEQYLETSGYVTLTITQK